MVVLKSSEGGASRPLIVILQQIKHGDEQRHDALPLLEWPLALYDVQDDIGLGTRLEVVVPLKLMDLAPRDVRLEASGGDNLQTVLGRRTDSAPDDI